MTNVKKEEKKSLSEKQERIIELVPAFFNFVTLRMIHRLDQTNFDRPRFELTVYMENGEDAPVKMTYDRDKNGWCL